LKADARVHTDAVAGPRRPKPSESSEFPTEASAPAPGGGAGAELGRLGSGRGSAFNLFFVVHLGSVGCIAQRADKVIPDAVFLSLSLSLSPSLPLSLSLSLALSFFLSLSLSLGSK